MALAERVREQVSWRLDRQPSWVLLVELFIGLGWLRAAVAKLLAPAWWRGDTIQTFVAEQTGRGLPWWDPFLQEVVLEHLEVVAALVLAGQFVAGSSLLLARYLGIGLTVGMTMNLTFILTGAVDPSVFYLILQAVIALWLYEQHAERSVGIRSMTAFMVAGIVVAAASVPFIESLAPMAVIDDAATVLATYSLTIVAATFAARRRLVAEREGLLATRVGADRIVRDTVVAGEPVPPLRDEADGDAAD